MAYLMSKDKGSRWVPQIAHLEFCSWCTERDCQLPLNPLQSPQTNRTLLISRPLPAAWCLLDWISFHWPSTLFKRFKGQLKPNRNSYLTGHRLQFPPCLSQGSEVNLPCETQVARPSPCLCYWKHPQVFASVMRWSYFFVSSLTCEK